MLKIVHFVSLVFGDLLHSFGLRGERDPWTRWIATGAEYEGPGIKEETEKSGHWDCGKCGWRKEGGVKRR